MKNKMEQERMREKIKKQYNMFNIPEETIPAYSNPHQFAKTFKKCSALLYKDVSYSDSTTQEPNVHADKEDRE